MSLYFWLLFGSIFVPLVLSFDKRLHFYTRWKYVLPAIFLVAVLYIVFDIHFTRRGHWGFNPRYLSGAQLFGLPIEECLFFLVVPYASIFLHAAILEYFPQVELSKRNTLRIGTAIIVFALLLAFLNTGKSYTFYIFAKLLIAVGLTLWLEPKVLGSFLITFFVILIPFLIVNGILTGSFIPEEVVWYNNAENLGIRIFTIPVEDVAYAFSMILLSLFLSERLKKLY